MRKSLQYIDLFCGCGGWSEGFSQLGYKCLYSVDNWKPAAKTHAYNHPGIFDDDRAKDILDSTVIEHIRKLLKSGEVDVLIGSPPCTQFSFANRGGKGNIVEGMVLVRKYLELIDYIQNDLGNSDFPWVLENVPRMKDFLETECVDKENNRYRFNYIESNKYYTITIPKIVVLNSADYGAPQKRKRVFCGNFKVPKITHVSPKIKKDKVKFDEFCFYYNINATDRLKLLNWKTIKEVLEKLPNPSTKTKSKKIIKDPNYDLRLQQSELNDHFYNTKINEGLELFECHELKQHHPVYGVMNFPDDLNEPARTIMATEMKVSREAIIIPINYKKYKNSLGKKSYNEIVSESNDVRVQGFRRLTIRELACLQGFPINYQFTGETSSVKHKQIGNAVSPFISNAFANMFLMDYFNKKRTTKFNHLSRETVGFDKTTNWNNSIHAKNKNKFNRHLRSTKSDGQRVDVFYDESYSDSWEAYLCIGSGPKYKRIKCDDSLIKKIINSYKLSSNLLFNEIDVQEADVSINDLVDFKSFNEFRLADCFTKYGNIKKKTPLYFVETGIDKIIKKKYKAFYNSIVSNEFKISLKEYNLKKSISIYTLLALMYTCKLVNEVNSQKSSS